MIDREKVILGLEHCGPPMECDECPYDTEVGNCFTNLKTDALELLKEQEEELQIAATQGFHDGYSQAMSEITQYNMTPEERLDWENVQEVRNSKQSVRYICNGSYVILRRDIYDDYMAKLRGDHGLKYVFKYNDTPVLVKPEDISETDMTVPEVLQEWIKYFHSEVPDDQDTCRSPVDG